MRKLPRHTHYPEEAETSYSSSPSINSIPVLDWTKMAFQTWQAFQAAIQVTAQNIFDIIGEVMTFIEWTAAQIQTVFVNWSHLVATGALGLLDFAADLWSGVVKTANLAMQNILDALGSISKAAIKILLTSWAWISDATLGLGKMAYDYITGTFATFKSTITDAISWAWSEITKTAQNVLDTLGALSKAAITTLLTSWAWMSDVTLGLGKMAYTYITGTFAAFKSTITDTISWAWSEITKTAQNVLDTLGSISKAAIKTLLTSWEWMSDITLGLGKMVYTYITGTFAAFKSTITDTISWAWSEITKTASDIVNTIGNVIKSIYDAGNVAWTVLASGVQTTITAAGAWIGTLIESIKNAGAVVWSYLSLSLPRENQIYNGEFEIDFNSDGIPDGWFYYANAGVPTYGRSSAESYKGKYSVYITTTASSIGTFWCDYIPVQPNRKYVITVCLKGSKNGTSGSNTFDIVFYDANKANPVWIGSGDSSVTTSWIQKSFVATAGATARYAMIRLVNYQFDGTIYFDDVQCYEQKNLAEFIIDDLLGWNKIAGTFATFKAAITDTISWAWSEITKTAADVINTIGSIIKTIYDAGSVAWTQITKTATEVVTTIANWGNIITSFGAWSVAQILGVLTSWTQVTNVSALGSFPIAKLDIQPYKLPTSAYNYIANPSFEYGTWGGSETISTYNPKFGKQYVTLDAVGNTYSGYSNYIDIRGLTYFSVSVWLAGTVITGNFYLDMYCYKADKTPCTPAAVVMETITTDQPPWTQHTRTFNVSSELPSDCKFVRLQFIWWNVSSNPSGSMSVDGWQFNMGDQIPAFQDFTTYSFNWMPEKIETISTTELSWSTYSWTNILELTFECEAKMILIIETYCYSTTYSAFGSNAICGRQHQLTIDANSITGTFASLSGYVLNGETIHAPYACHTILVLEKGSHTLRLQMRNFNISNTVAYAYDRRLTILKGFYQGGTT